MQDDELSKSKAKMSSLRSPIRRQAELTLPCYGPTETSTTLGWNSSIGHETADFNIKTALRHD